VRCTGGTTARRDRRTERDLEKVLDLKTAGSVRSCWSLSLSLQPWKTFVVSAEPSKIVPATRFTSIAWMWCKYYCMQHFVCSKARKISWAMRQIHTVCYRCWKLLDLLENVFYQSLGCSCGCPQALPLFSDPMAWEGPSCLSHVRRIAERTRKSKAPE